MARQYFVRCPLLAILGLAGCLLASGCGKDSDTPTSDSVASGEPVQVQQPVEPDITTPPESPKSPKASTQPRTSGRTSNPQSGSESFEMALASLREAREPGVLFTLAKLQDPERDADLKQARADSQRRAIMAGAILDLVGNRSQNIVGAAARALPAWVVADNLPTVLDLLEKTQTPHKDLLRALGEIQDPRCATVLGSWYLKEGRVVSATFQKLGPALGEKEVLNFLHHPDRGAHDEARRILQTFKTSDDSLVNQTFLDLKAAEVKRRFAAAAWVEQRDPRAPRRAELVKAVEPLVTEREANVFRPALNALLKLGSADNMAAFEAFLKSGIPGDRRDIYVFLGKTKDARAAALLVRELDARDRGAGARCAGKCVQRPRRRGRGLQVVAERPATGSSRRRQCVADHRHQGVGPQPGESKKRQGPHRPGRRAKKALRAHRRSAADLGHSWLKMAGQLRRTAYCCRPRGWPYHPSCPVPVVSLRSTTG